MTGQVYITWPRHCMRGPMGGAKTSIGLMKMKFSVFIAVVALWCCVFSRADGAVANLVMLSDAPEKTGAMCLDGSAPGYYFRKGMGTGASKWMIHMEGGGWCADEDSCLDRSYTTLGSSKEWTKTDTFSGLLSDSQTENPDFYNWNLAYVEYCDGALFAGNVAKEVSWKGSKLYFRGFRIFQATLNALLNNGMKNATDVILTGCSAGGEAVYGLADYMKSVLPASIKYAAIADAGFFIDVPNIYGQDSLKQESIHIFKMQNMSDGTNHACVKAHAPENEEWKCLFGPYIEAHITSDLFGFNSKYDTWSLYNEVQLPCTPPKCNKKMMKALEKFGEDWAKASADFANRKGRGIFFDSCLQHCQSLDNAMWNSIKVGGQSARETVGNWYFGRSTGKAKEVDCPYPCNKSCV